MVQQLEERLYFEAVVQAERSMFATDARLTADNLQQIAPPAERATQAATALQSMDSACGTSGPSRSAGTAQGAVGERLRHPS